MNYCSNCGNSVTQRIPQGDNRPRFVCDNCETIHYQNPCIITGFLPTYEGKVLLCKRAIEPRYGLWTLPAGFMENGETTLQAALRETWEEALAEVESEGLYAIFNMPKINQVYIMFRGELKNTAVGPGEESLEVALFDEHEIPWDELAFDVMRKTLELYYQDIKKGEFPIRTLDITQHHRFPKTN
jgi:ADP-ribose pyrophosphatase YjhB (NUDIX family)